MANLTQKERDEILQILWEARDTAFWAEDAAGIPEHTEEKIVIDRAIDAIKEIGERLNRK